MCKGFLLVCLFCFSLKKMTCIRLLRGERAGKQNLLNEVVIETLVKARAILMGNVEKTTDSSVTGLAAETGECLCQPFLCS